MAALIVSIHVLSGGLAIVTGFLSLLSPKGSIIHVLSGRVFTGATLISGSAIVGLGIIGNDIADTFSGLSVLYFVITAWKALLPPKHTLAAVKVVDIALFVLVFCIVFVNLGLGLNAQIWSLEYPPAQYFIVTAIHLIAVVDDLVLLTKQKLDGVYRLIRHSWRMCLVLFIASGSFFLGQMATFPRAFIDHGFVFFFLPPLLPLVFMGYWLFKLFFKRKIIKIKGVL